MSDRLHRGKAVVCKSLAVAIPMVLAMPMAAWAVPTFVSTAGPDGPLNTGGGAISFGVAGLGAPISPGAPTYMLNNFNGRTDILTNPGIGATANPVIANNTSSVAGLPWTPPTYLFNTQVGGGNVNGPFGSGSAVITGPQFGYTLTDGGTPGGVSTSYELLTWDAQFTEAVGSAAGTIGTYITMGGNVPAVQDLAMIGMRTQLIGNTIGTVELPGLILAIERTGALTYNYLALQDNGIGGVTPMPGGYAILVNAPTGDFRALAFNALPDLGAVDGLAIPAGETLTARVTVTIYSDPASLDFIDALAPENSDLLTAAIDSTNTPFPDQFLFTPTAPTPEPSALTLALLGLLYPLRRRR